MYEFLCEPWPLEGCCDFETLQISPAITGLAWEAASEVLWKATGRQFGNCPVVLRPCRKDCSNVPADAYWAGGIIDAHWGYPYPALIDGAWVNLACGRCGGDCSCSATSEIVFPEYVRELVSVVVDGVTLVPNVDYQLLDRTRLVRLGDAEWPLCQDYTVTGGPGAWTVTASFGEDVPALGRLAVAALTCEIAKLCAGQECSLPSHAVSVTRQGVTFRGASDFMEKGLTGVFLPDLFITRINPNGYSDRMRAH